MVVKLQRPILVGGLGLSLSLWMLQSWHHSIMQLSELSLLSALAVGGGLWLFKHKLPKDSSEELNGTLVDRATAESAIAKTEAVINQLAQESENHPALEVLQNQLAQLLVGLDRQELKVAVTGGKLTGKSALIQVLRSSSLLQTQPQITFKETAPLFTKTDSYSDADILTEVAKSDAVLFLTNGDLTDSQFQALQQLKLLNQPKILVFNKQDQFLPDERASILLSLKQRVSDNIVAVSASPIPIKVRKHEADGAVQEWMEQPAPEIQQLTQELSELLAQQNQKLVWTTSRREAILLKAEAKNCLNGVRRDRSTPIIEQYQWIAAAAAFANPVPALDILATAAINAQMVMDLGKIYQQKLSWEQAQTVAGTMGSLMLKLGLVELSTKAIGTVLKSNAVTFVAGGLVQGVSAAYLTRVAALSLVEYFEQQEIALDSGNTLNLDKLRQTLQKVFQQNQQIAFLQGFVKQSIKHLSPEIESVEVVG